ncbi:hypothetical protein, partial [Bradyrhizobium sp. BR 10289]|uniref:hypothetical protein n=1 Tax=Bradyrhizobium sp. BR 10289 TaxID=2749993 RepID=UPI001C64C323
MADAQTNSDGQSNVEAFIEGIGAKAKRIAETRVSETLAAASEARASLADFGSSLVDHHFGDATDDQVLTSATKAIEGVTNTVVTGLGGQDLAHAVTGLEDSGRDLGGKLIDYHFGAATSDQVLDAAGKVGADVSNAIVTGLAGKDTAEAIAGARDSGSDLIKTGIDYHFGDATGDQVLNAVGRIGGAVSNAIVTGLGSKDLASAVTEARDRVSDLAKTAIDYQFGDATGDQVLDAAGKAGGDISNAIVTGLAGKDVAAAVTKARDGTSDLVGTGIDYHFGEATGDQVLDAAGKASGDVSNA